MIAVTLILAAASADAAAMQNGQWISSFQFYLLLVLNGVALAKLFFPQRRTVAMEGEFTQRRDFEAHAAANHKEHESLFVKLGGVERGIRGEVKADIDKIYVEVNRLREGQAAGNALTHAQDRKLETMDHKLDRLIEGGSKR